MPHSLPPDKSDSQEDDYDLLPDAPPANAATMTELAGDGAMELDEGNNAVDKMDVKLQDLFDDMDEEDDEFSSSKADSKVKTESSPPPAQM